MWITSSSLSTSRPSLPPSKSHSAQQLRAQELAQALIQSYSARHVVHEVQVFLEKECACELVLERDIITLTHSLDASTLPEVPSPYGVKGGAAREALIAALGHRPSRHPRDLDLVRRGHHPLPDDNLIAERLMTRDFALGARVELIRDMARYLSSRDLTINEVVAIDGKVHATLLCALDSIGGVLRPARYRGGTLHRAPSLQGQALLKMVRLYAEGAYFDEAWSIVGIPPEVSFSDFDLAVHLNKAFQRGRRVAEVFVETCGHLALIPPSEEPLRVALQELAHLRHGEQGLFPDVPAEAW